MTLDALKRAESQEERPFGEREEEAVVSLIFDHPEFFIPFAQYLQYRLFDRAEAQYVVARVMKYYDKYNVFPSREMLLDLVKHELTVDSEGLEEVLQLIRRKSDLREIPAIKEKLLKWVRGKAFGLLYDDDTIKAYQEGDYVYLERIINEARNIQDLGSKSLWFFDQIEKLFDVDHSQKLTTGYGQLDSYLHVDDPERGPARQEMVVWMAPTGVGKCHTLQSKIIERKLSRIFELELENGQTIKAAGHRTVQTQRGNIRVCDLAETDDIIEIPDQEVCSHIRVPDMQV